MSLKYIDITEKIFGGAMRVHQKMKVGYVESVYQKCMTIELRKTQLNFLQKVKMPIYYYKVLVDKRRVDYLVEEKILVELKALSELTNQHSTQAVNYPETHNLEVGLLINFGAKSLQFKRLINQKKLKQQGENPAHPIIL